MRLIPLLLVCSVFAPGLRAEDSPFLYPQTEAFKKGLATAQTRGDRKSTRLNSSH